MIKIIGIGKTGVRLLGTLMSLGLRKALEGEDKWPTRNLRFISVETDIGDLVGANADVGFYLGAPGDSDSQPEAMARMSARAQQALAHELRGAWLILLLVEAGDALECAAAAGIAELADRARAMAVSLVAWPGFAADGTVAKTDYDQLTRIRAASDVVLSFFSEERELVGDACFMRNGEEPVPSGMLINCAYILLKAITLPYQQLVGCDYQDIRTVLDTPLRLDDGLAGLETAFFQRIVVTLEGGPEAIIEQVSADLSLWETRTVLVYLEGGPSLKLENVKEIIRTIQSMTSESAFMKYCVELRPERPGTAVAVNLIVNPNAPLFGELEGDQQYYLEIAKEIIGNLKGVASTPLHRGAR